MELRLQRSKEGGASDTKVGSWVGVIMTFGIMGVLVNMIYSKVNYMNLYKKVSYESLFIKNVGFSLVLQQKHSFSFRTQIFVSILSASLKGGGGRACYHHTSDTLVRHSPPVVAPLTIFGKAAPLQGP